MCPCAAACGERNDEGRSYDAITIDVDVFFCFFRFKRESPRSLCFCLILSSRSQPLPSTSLLTRGHTRTHIHSWTQRGNSKKNADLAWYCFSIYDDDNFKACSLWRRWWWRWWWWCIHFTHKWWWINYFSRVSHVCAMVQKSQKNKTKRALYMPCSSNYGVGVSLNVDQAINQARSLLSGPDRWALVFFLVFFLFFFGFRTRFVRFAGAPLSFADIPRELSTASTEHGPITAAIAVVVVGIFGGRHWNWLWYSFGRRRRRRRPRSTTAKWMRKCASTRTGPTRARPDSLGDFISGQGGTSVSEVVCFCRLLMRFHGEDDHFKVFAAFRRRRLLCGRPPPYLTVPRCFFVFLPSFTVFLLSLGQGGRDEDGVRLRKSPSPVANFSVSLAACPIVFRRELEPIGGPFLFFAADCFNANNCQSDAARLALTVSINGSNSVELKPTVDQYEGWRTTATIDTVVDLIDDRSSMSYRMTWCVLSLRTRRSSFSVVRSSVDLVDLSTRRVLHWNMLRHSPTVFKGKKGIHWNESSGQERRPPESVSIFNRENNWPIFHIISRGSTLDHLETCFPLISKENTAQTESYSLKTYSLSSMRFCCEITQKLSRE